MSHLKNLLLASVVGAMAFTSVGCIAGAEVGVAASYEAPPPQRLVYVSPGIWVVENQNAGVFYHDGFYWTNRSGYWYRSSYYNRGFVYWSAPPVYVTRIRRPNRYRHYRAPRRARTRYINHTRSRPAYRNNNRRPTYRNNRRPARRPDYNNRTRNPRRDHTTRNPRRAYPVPRKQRERRPNRRVHTGGKKAYPVPRKARERRPTKRTHTKRKPVKTNKKSRAKKRRHD